MVDQQRASEGKAGSEADREYFAEHRRLQDAYDTGVRLCKCPDPDSTELERIEVEFAIPVEMTQEQQRRLVELLGDIADSPWNQVKEGCHWLSGIGTKMHWSKVDAALLGKKPEPGAPESGDPTYDRTVFHVETFARAFVSEQERERVLLRREADAKRAASDPDAELARLRHELKAQREGMPEGANAGDLQRLDCPDGPGLWIYRTPAVVDPVTAEVWLPETSGSLTLWESAGRLVFGPPGNPIPATFLAPTRSKWWRAPSPDRVLEMGAEIARLRRELKAQREGMGREIGRLAEENEKLWEELVWPFENSDGEWFTLTNVDVSGVETEKYGAPPNEDDGLCYFPTKEGCIAAVREALCLPPLPNSGPDGEGSDTD